MTTMGRGSPAASRWRASAAMTPAPFCALRLPRTPSAREVFCGAIRGGKCHGQRGTDRDAMRQRRIDVAQDLGAAVRIGRDLVAGRQERAPVALPLPQGYRASLPPLVTVDLIGAVAGKPGRCNARRFPAGNRRATRGSSREDGPPADRKARRGEAPAAMREARTQTHRRRRRNRRSEGAEPPPAWSGPCRRILSPRRSVRREDAVPARSAKTPPTRSTRAAPGPFQIARDLAFQRHVGPAPEAVRQIDGQRPDGAEPGPGDGQRKAGRAQRVVAQVILNLRVVSRIAPGNHGIGGGHARGFLGAEALAAGVKDEQTRHSHMPPAHRADPLAPVDLLPVAASEGGIESRHPVEPVARHRHAEAHARGRGWQRARNAETARDLIKPVGEFTRHRNRLPGQRRAEDFRRVGERRD